jgi:hypothetical protein
MKKLVIPKPSAGAILINFFVDFLRFKLLYHFIFMSAAFSYLFSSQSARHNSKRSRLSFGKYHQMLMNFHIYRHLFQISFSYMLNPGAGLGGLGANGARSPVVHTNCNFHVYFLLYLNKLYE